MANRLVSMITARMDKGLSQEELAGSCGLSRASINSYERGRAVPPITTAKKIATVLNIPWTDMYE